MAMIDHKSIKESISWILDKTFNNGKKRKRNLKYLVLEKSYPHKVFLSSKYKHDFADVFTTEAILRIVDIDLSTAYQTKGRQVFNQKKGCPMGGLLSAIYANVKCSYDEIQFIQKLGENRKRIFAIRQMDDLICWVAYNRNNTKSYNEALTIKNKILTTNGVYKGGLELEEQKHGKITDHYTVHKFAGAIIHCKFENEISITTQLLNKNSESLRTNYQKFPRYISKHSNVSEKYKKSTIIGTMHRALNLSPNINLLRLATWENYVEFKVCNYPITDFFEALIHMTKYNDEDNTWKKVIEWFTIKVKTEKEGNEKERKKIENKMHYVLGLHDVPSRENQTAQSQIG